MNYSEQEIINQLKRGDERAYRHLFDTQYKLLCHIAAEYLKDDFLAETIVGDAIFHLWEIRESFEIRVSIRAYLVQSVRNRCINYLQQEYVVKETQFSPTDEPLLMENLLSAPTDHPLGTLLERELEQEIYRSINNLPSECRLVFEMSRFQNLKYHEIAERLNISVNTVKYHIKNALSRLNSDLAPYLASGIAIWWLLQ
jgi:RNA polymerase sigma-70 factor, ECF subfamily